MRLTFLTHMGSFPTNHNRLFEQSAQYRRSVRVLGFGLHRHEMLIGIADEWCMYVVVLPNCVVAYR